MSIPIDGNLFNHLISEINNKNAPKFSFDLAFANSYKLTSYHKEHHLSREYLYLTMPEEEYSSSILGLASIGVIYSGRKKELDFKYPTDAEKMFVKRAKNDSEVFHRIDETTDNTNQKMLLHLQELNKKGTNLHQVVVLGLIIISILIFFN
jgi:hypothetical protein